MDYLMNENYLDTVFSLPKSSMTDIPDSFAIVTAYNPMDKILSIEHNEARNLSLKEDVKKLGLVARAIIGRSTDGTHQEASLMIMCTQILALELANQYDQRAIFWIDRLVSIAFQGCTTRFVLEVASKPRR